MKIRPLNDRVLVTRVEEEQKTAGGIIIPDTAKEKPQQGMIEAVGDEEEMFSDLTAGDKVLFPKYSGTEIKMNGVEYLIMEESDVLARISE